MNPKNIRNFCIISHIDHGKSTLADRLLELTNTVEKRKMKEQVLDSMDLEREKGITIKLQPARMEYESGSERYVLNLIDTPGHVDFGYEVSRSLAAVEGALLLVDASQGIQAQTLANLNLAQEQNLIIIPIINKIDLAHAQVDEVALELSRLLNIDQSEIIKISAKNSINIEQIIKAVIKRIPAPAGDRDKPLRALIFDSSYDTYKGVVAYVRIVDGSVARNSKVALLASGAKTEAIEVGVFKPEPFKKDSLACGEIGYIATGLKEVSQCRVGDTIADLSKEVKPLVGYQEAKPVVFASFYPVTSDDYDLLKDGLAKLKLNDAALQYKPESTEGLGRGFRCGFLGMLHLEIISERLKREFKLDLVISSPSVSYKLKSKIISSPADLPDTGKIEGIEEPWMLLEIITPSQYLGPIMKLLDKVRAEYENTEYLAQDKALLKYRAPLAEIIVDFYDKLKNISSGYASMSYQLLDYRPADLVRLDVLVAGDKVDAFSKIIHKDNVYQEGRALVEKLKQVIPPQLFSVALQAVVGGKVIARETISAMRKDVTGYLYGGDYTRKRKLLEKQKKGKKKMKAMGKVNIPSEVFLKVLKK